MIGLLRQTPVNLANYFPQTFGERLILQQSLT
jgi:hypothetical protein